MQQTSRPPRLDDCMAYAEAASRRARARYSEEPTLRAVLRVIGQGRRRQLQRLYVGAEAEPAAAPASGVGSTPSLAPPLKPALELGAEPASASVRSSARVLGLRRLTPDLLVLRLSRPAGFRYAAGQHAKLRIGRVSRAYSLVSAPHQPWLEFFIELHPGGPMSGLLSRLRTGELVGLDAPKGDLRLSSDRPRHLMVATVTGIAPFVSLLREQLNVAGGGEIHLLHGASHMDEFGYADELAAMAALHPDRWHYTAAVSRPDDPRNSRWQGQTGRVVDLLAGYVERNALSAADTALYACGHPQMVAAVRDQWGPRGFEIQVEPY